MEKLLNELEAKVENCPDNTKEWRARKGAWVDCIVMIKNMMEIGDGNMAIKITKAIKDSTEFDGDGSQVFYNDVLIEKFKVLINSELLLFAKWIAENNFYTHNENCFTSAGMKPSDTFTDKQLVNEFLKTQAGGV